MMASFYVLINNPVYTIPQNRRETGRFPPPVGAAQGDMTAGENYYHGGLVRHDFTPKEAYRVIRELFTRTWHTELTLETDTDELDFKGFYGVYELEIEADGKTVRREIHLDRDSNSCFHIVI